jgi:subtilisin family serine protease
MRNIAGLVALTAFLAACNTAPIPEADDLPNPSAFGRSLSGLAAQATTKNSKLSTELRLLGGAGAGLRSQSASAGFVTVDVLSNEPETLLAQLRGLGLRNGSVFEGTVSGRLPINALSKLEGMANVRFARQSRAVRNATSQGIVVSQGDKAQASDVARARYGVSGRGVKVGVLSDSYDQYDAATYGPPRTTAAQDIANGDLPAAGVEVIEDLTEPGSDEGRAMLQIVHDVAPDAPLAFATAFTGEAGFANNIIRLADAGSRVIVDDISYLFAPMFQDGIVAQAVDRVTARGVTYFSSAGNRAKQSYEAPFRKSGTIIPDVGELHDFKPGAGVDGLMRFSIPAGGEMLLVFQWDEPFASVSRNGRGSKSDLDMYVFDDAGNLIPPDPANNVFSVSTDSNIDADPVEAVLIPNPSATAINVNVLITLFAGKAPDRIKWVDFGNALPLEFDTQSPTTYGHSNSRGAAAVGAARYDRTPAFGQNPPLLQSFSARGGTPILRNKNGGPTFEIRPKPLFVGPNCADTSFFFIFTPDFDGTGFPNFCGTSASAPHAAGVAALILERYRLNPLVVQGLMAATAINMDRPGFDFDTGFGLIQADRAVGVLSGGWGR